MIHYLIFLFYVWIHFFQLIDVYTLKPCRESPINLIRRCRLLKWSCLPLNWFLLAGVISRMSYHYIPDVNDLYSSEFHQREITTKGLIRYLNNNKEYQRKQKKDLPTMNHLNCCQLYNFYMFLLLLCYPSLWTMKSWSFYAAFWMLCW